MASIVAKILGDGKGFDKTVAGVDGKLAGLKKGFSGLKSLLATVGIGAFAKSLIQTGSHLTDVSDKLGVTTDFLQKFNFMARESGIANTASEMGLQRFIRRLGEAQQGMGELLPILTQYDIALFDASGSARTAEEVLADYADTVAATKDPQEKLRLAFKAFDSEGAALVSVLEQGSAGMDQMGRQAEKLGQVISGEQLERMDVYADRIDRITTATRTLGTELLGRVIGAIETFGEKVTAIFTGSEQGLLDQGFRDAAEAALRFNNEVVKVNKNVFAGQGTVTVAEEYVKQGEKLVPLQEAITAKAEEMRVSAEKSEESRKEILETAKEQEKVETQIAASTNKQTMLKKELASIFDDIDDKSNKNLIAEQKKTAELEKQRAALEEQRMELEKQLATQTQQAAAFESTGQFGFSFQDILNGDFSGTAQRAAERVLFLQKRAQDALFFSGADSEAFQRASGFAQDAQTNFENRFGVDPVENPFKNALRETETELKEIKEGIEKL